MNMICENIETDKRKTRKTTARTHGEALEQAVRMIAEAREKRPPSLDHGYILFVPDKYTLLAEKLLYARGGAFDVEALTLNRLYYRVADGIECASGKPLSRLGAVLTVRRILSEKRDELECYRNSTAFAGFGETVYDNLCQFAASGLGSRDLPTEGDDVTAHKLRDLKLIYAAYEEATAGKYVDSSGRMKLLYELLESTRFFDNTDVYFACYDGFTPMQARVVERICEKAEAGGNTATVIGAECKLSVRAKKVLRCKCNTRADELKTAAVRIKDLVNGGARYGEIGVVAPSADFNRLKRIFDEYGVRFFTDCKYALSSHPLARYLLDLFAAGEHGRNDDYVRLAHNPYSGISRDDADIFENYISYCALGEGAVKSEFTVDPAEQAMRGSLKKAERVRKEVAALADRLKKRKIYNGEGLCAAIEEVLPKDSAETAERIDSPIEDVREKIIENAALLKEVFRGPTGLAVMLEALEEVFALYSVSILPNEADCVVVGDTSVFRAGGYKYLFVLSMHEGELPLVMRDDGMLSDSDLDIIASRVAKVEPKIEERNARAISELYSVLSYAEEEIYVSWCGDCTPSNAMNKLISAARKANAEVVEFSRDAMLYKLCDRDEVSAELLVKLCPTVAAARELYLLGRADIAAGGKGYGYEKKLKAAVGEPDYGQREAIAAHARALYGERGISVSQVQEYFACPFRGYARYALRLKPRPVGEVTPLDLGNFLHTVIEKFFGKSMDGDYSDVEGKVRRAVKEILEGNPQALKGASDGFIAELTAEAVKAASAAAEQVKKGAFTPRFVEVKFGFSGDDCELCGYEVELGDGGKIMLEGKIDRLDLKESGDGKGAVRIIDYKTGKAEFVLSDIYYGRKIQLPIYLKVAKANGYVPVGMFYFPFSSDFEEKKNSYRLLGMYDSGYAYEMDKGLIQPNYTSTVVKARSLKDSEINGVRVRKGDSGVEGEELKAVCDYAEKVFALGADEMLGGNCEPSPLVAGQKSECDYCEMKALCTAFGSGKRERKRVTVKTQFVALCAVADKTGKKEENESGKAD